MRYKTAQFRRAWNRLAKREHSIPNFVTNKELHSQLQERHFCSERRFCEMSQYESQDGTVHEIEF